MNAPTLFQSRRKWKSLAAAQFSLADPREILHDARMQRLLPALLIVALLAAFRVLGSAFPEQLPNLQPLPAVLLCSFIFLKGSQRWLLPLFVWLVTDPLASVLQGYPVFGWHNLSVLLGVGITVGVAHLAARRPTVLPVLGAAALSAVAFYFFTNLVSFLFDPLYPKSWLGFTQAQWTGPEGFGPTWVFLRNAVAGNLAFTGLFFAAFQSLPQPSVNSTQALAR
jgi:hypothetical protein